MTVKELLEKPYRLKKRIMYLERELEHYNELMYWCSSPQYDQPKVDKSPSNTTPNMYGIIMISETEEKIRVAKEEYDKVCKEVNELIEKVENEEYRILLKYKYLEYQSLAEISDLMFVCYKTIQRWYKKAMNEINKNVL